MKNLANSATSWVGLCRDRAARLLATFATLLAISGIAQSAAAAPADDARAIFERFITAQNAHDVKSVESLLLAGPDFLWITRGTPIWGQEAAIKRFAALYEGTWHLDPDPSGLKIIMIGNEAAQIYDPIVFTISASGQPPQQSRFLMNLLLVKTATGWRVSSILPIPAPM